MASSSRPAPSSEHAALADALEFGIRGNVGAWYEGQEDVIRRVLKQVADKHAVSTRSMNKKKKDKAKAQLNGIRGDAFEALLAKHMEKHLAQGLRVVCGSTRVDDVVGSQHVEKDIVVLNAATAPAFGRPPAADEVKYDGDRDWRAIAERAFAPEGGEADEFILDEATVARVEVKLTVTNTTMGKANKQTKSGTGQKAMLASSLAVGRVGAPVRGVVGYTVADKLKKKLRTTQDFSTIDFVVAVEDNFACVRPRGSRKFVVVEPQPGLALALLNFCVQGRAGEMARSPLVSRFLHPFIERQLAEDSAESDAHLGNAYFNGNGVEENKPKAMRLFRKAVERGHVTAKYWLGVCLTKDAANEGGGDEAKVRRLVEAAVLYREAAEKGVVDAMYNYGCCLRDGHGVEANTSSAIEWFRKGAAAGDTDSRSVLGAMLLQTVLESSKPGHELVPLKKEAMDALQQAADAGNMAAVSNLGVAMAKGTLGEADPTRAAELYQKAAEADIPTGMYNYACRLLSGLGVDKNECAGINMLKKAANAGESSAQAKLAWHLFTGDLPGLDQDLDGAQAAKMAERSAEQGDPNGMLILAKALVLESVGASVSKDPERAVDLLRTVVSVTKPDESMLAEYVDASSLLALLAISGVGMEKDPRFCVEWLRDIIDRDVTVEERDDGCTIERRAMNPRAVERVASLLLDELKDDKDATDVCEKALELISSLPTST